MPEELLIVVATFSCVASGVYWLSLACDRRTARCEARVGELLGGGSGAGEVSPGFKELPGSLQSVARVLQKYFPVSQADQGHQQRRLVQAGLYSPIALSVFIAIRLLSVITPPLIAVLLVRMDLAPARAGMASGIALGALGAIAPGFWLDMRIAQRQRKLRRAMPDFLDLLTICLEGGLSIQAALQRVTDECAVAHPLLASELSIVKRDLDLGSTPDAALKRFAIRTGCDGARSLASLLKETSRFGTPLSSALREHAEMMRMQREVQAEEQANKAAVKILLPTMLLIFPAVFVVVAGPAAIQIQEAFAKR